MKDTQIKGMADEEHEKLALFAAVANNLDKTTAEIAEKYSDRIEQKKLVKHVDALTQRGWIQPATKDENELKWVVTDLGRVKLMQQARNARFDIMTAKLKDKPEKHVKELEAMKTLFTKAFRRSEKVFGQ